MIIEVSNNEIQYVLSFEVSEESSLYKEVAILILTNSFYGYSYNN